MAYINQNNVIIQGIKNLNIEVVDFNLDPDRTYLNLEKSDFIAALSVSFDLFRKKGDASLDVMDGRCKFSNSTIGSYIFSGKQSKNYIEINFEVIEGKVVGLFECYCFTQSFENDSVRLYIDLEKGSPF